MNQYTKDLMVSCFLYNVDSQIRMIVIFHIDEY